MCDVKNEDKLSLRCVDRIISALWIIAQMLVIASALYLTHTALSMINSMLSRLQ